MKNNDFGKLITFHREALGLKKYKLAEKLGKSAVSVGDYEAGTIKPKMEVVIRLADIFNLDEQKRKEFYRESKIPELLDYKKTVIDNIKINKNELRRIPILSQVQASHFREVVLAELDEQTEYRYTDCSDPMAFLVRVQGDCMEDELKEGELVVISPNSQYCHNDFVLAMDKRNFECTLKQFKDYRDGKPYLHPYNNKYDDIKIDQHIEIIGCVVEKTKKYKG